MSRSARACTPGRNRPCADQPVARDGVLAEQPLLEAGGEHVGDRLVERARLALVDQPGGPLGDRVRELVAQHVDRLGEPVEDLAVAVAEDQLLAVPERVVVVPLVVHGRDHRGAGVVVGVAAVDLGEHRQRGRHAVRGLVDRGVPGRRVAGLRDQVAGQLGARCRAVCTTHAGPRPPPRRTTVRCSRTASSCASIRSTQSASSGRLSAIWRSRYGGTKQRLTTAPGPAGSRRWRRSPALGGDPHQRLALLAHRGAVVLPVGVLAGDAAEVLDQPVLGLLARHVEDLRGAVDLHPRVVPLVGEHEHRGPRVAAQVGGLGAVGVGRDDDPPVAVDPAGHRRELGAPVGAMGDQHQVVAGADEVEQLLALDPGVRRDLGHAASITAGVVRRCGSGGALNRKVDPCARAENRQPAQRRDRRARRPRQDHAGRRDAAAGRRVHRPPGRERRRPGHGLR